MEQPVLPTSAAKRFVSELGVGERVDTNFLMRRCDLRTGRTGQAYLALEFADKSGYISARMWDNAAAASRAITEGDFVRVVGVVETYQGTPQLKVERLAPADPRHVDPGDYMPASKRDLDEMYAELQEVVEAIENPHLRQLLRAAFSDPEVASRFRRAPGGVRLHHAWIGGLLEHTLSVVGLARRAAEHYPSLDRDLLIAGACLHDLGKIWELSYEQSFDYTEEGQLVGHLLLETGWLGRLIDELDRFPPPLRSHLMHLLASHHGTKEHGAAMEPATREALVLHYLDDLDSKMAAVEAAIAAAEATGATTAYSRSLGRRVVRRRWDEVDE